MKFVFLPSSEFFLFERRDACLLCVINACEILTTVNIICCYGAIYRVSVRAVLTKVPLWRCNSLGAVSLKS